MRLSALITLHYTQTSTVWISTALQKGSKGIKRQFYTFCDSLDFYHQCNDYSVNNFHLLKSKKQYALSKLLQVNIKDKQLTYTMIYCGPGFMLGHTTFGGKHIYIQKCNIESAIWGVHNVVSNDVCILGVNVQPK